MHLGSRGQATKAYSAAVWHSNGRDSRTGKVAQRVWRYTRRDEKHRGVLEADLECSGGPFELLLVNAAHIKNVPGRKTDTKDCEWIAQLLQHGLLKGSFVPERSVREFC